MERWTMVLAAGGLGLATVVSAQLESVVQLTPQSPVTDLDVRAFALTPDGQTVLYIADQQSENKFELYSNSINGGIAQKISDPINSDEDVQSVLVDPTGTRVVYLVVDEGDDSSEIFSANIDGSGTAVSLTNTLDPDGRVTRFVIDPTGTRAAFFFVDPSGGGIGAGTLPDLYRVNLSGGNPSRISGPPDRDILNFDFLPDGSRLIYHAANLSNGQVDLFTVSNNNVISTRLNDALLGSGRVVTYALSPDSERVVFVSDQQGNQVFDLYSVSATGGNPDRITQNLTRGTRPDDIRLAITPRSDRVIFRSDFEAAEALGLFRVGITGGSVRDVGDTNTAGRSVATFAVTPDSNRVVFTSDRNAFDRFDLFSTDLDSGNPIQLSDTLPASGSVRRVALASDNRSAVFFGNARVSGTNELFRVPIGGGNVMRLNNDLVSGGNVVEESILILPDATRVAFIAGQDISDQPELFLASADFGGPIQLNQDLGSGGRIDDFRVTDAGNTVVYLATIGGEQALFARRFGLILSPFLQTRQFVLGTGELDDLLEDFNNDGVIDAADLVRRQRTP